MSAVVNPCCESFSVNKRRPQTASRLQPSPPAAWGQGCPPLHLWDLRRGCPRSAVATAGGFRTLSGGLVRWPKQPLTAERGHTRSHSITLFHGQLWAKCGQPRRPRAEPVGGTKWARLGWIPVGHKQCPANRRGLQQRLTRGLEGAGSIPVSRTKFDAGQRWFLRPESDGMNSM
jgi:hypothetical protein